MVLTLYVVAGSESDQLASALGDALGGHLGADRWVLNVIDVIASPHKAMENEIFVTPTLVREVPKPVMKFMGAISQIQDVLAIINNTHTDTSSVLAY